jgi:hypothetical protein
MHKSLIYATVIKDIGLLTSREAAQVIRAYATIDRLDANLSRHYRVASPYMEVEESSFLSVKLVLYTACQRARAAVNTLEGVG